MNELLFFATIILSFSALLAVYRFWGKTGLFAWIAFASVFANIEVLQTVEIFGLETTLGNALFGTIFLATDILSEKYSSKDSKWAIFLGFSIEAFLVAITQLDIAFIPSETNFVSSSFETLFKLTPRICLGSMIAFMVGNLLDVSLYSKLKQIHGNRLMWLRNNLCTLVSQLVDNFVFYTISFSGIMSFSNIAIICINVWIMEAFVAVLDTPFLYIAKRIKAKN